VIFYGNGILMRIIAACLFLFASLLLPVTIFFFFRSFSYFQPSKTRLAAQAPYCPLIFNLSSFFIWVFFPPA